MGQFRLFVVVFCILLLPHDTTGGRLYAANQEKLGSSSLGEMPLVHSQGNVKPINLKIDGLTSPCVDPLLYMIKNGSGKVQHTKHQASLLANEGKIMYFVTGQKTLHAQQGYYGAEASIEVYGSSLDLNQESGAMVLIANTGGDTSSNYNSIHVGWHVRPSMYGDSSTRFFVHWTRDRYQKTGCYNLDCPGYVPEEGTALAPGTSFQNVSDPNGVKQNIILEVFKDGAGDWLVHCGFDSEPYLIGRFPKSLFTGLADKANDMMLAGYVYTPTTQLAPMGSGFLPNNAKAASFNNVQFVDQNGKTFKAQHDFATYETSDQDLYSTSQLSPEGKFSYGGPWK